MSASIQIDQALHALSTLREFVQSIQSQDAPEDVQDTLQGYLSAIRHSAGSARTTLYEPVSNHRLQTQSDDPFLQNLKSQQLGLQQHLQNHPSLALSLTPSTVNIDTIFPLNPDESTLPISLAISLARGELVDNLNPREFLTHQQDFLDVLVHKAQSHQYQLQQLRSSIQTQKSIHTIASMESLLDLPKITQQHIDEVIELQQTNRSFEEFFTHFISNQNAQRMQKFAKKATNSTNSKNSIPSTTTMDDIDESTHSNVNHGTNFGSIELSPEYINIQRVFVHELYQRVQQDKLAHLLDTIKEKLSQSISRYEESESKFSEKCSTFCDSIDSMYHFFSKQTLPTPSHFISTSQTDIDRISSLFTLSEDSFDTSHEEQCETNIFKRQKTNDMSTDDLVELSTPQPHLQTSTSNSMDNILSPQDRQTEDENNDEKDQDTIIIANEKSQHHDDSDNVSPPSSDNVKTGAHLNERSRRINAMVENLTFFQRLIDPLASVQDVPIHKLLYRLLDPKNEHDDHAHFENEDKNDKNDQNNGQIGQIGQNSQNEDTSDDIQSSLSHNTDDNNNSDENTPNQQERKQDPILGIPIDLLSNQFSLTFPPPANMSFLATPLYRLASLFVQLQRLSWPTMQIHIVHTRDYILSPTSTITSTHFDPTKSVLTQQAPHISSLFMNTNELDTISTALDTYSLLITVPTIFSTSQSGYYSTSITSSLEISPTQQQGNAGNTTATNSNSNSNLDSNSQASQPPLKSSTDEGLSLFASPRQISDQIMAEIEDDNQDDKKSKNNRVTNKKITKKKKIKRLTHLDDSSSLHFLFSYVPTFTSVVMFGYTSFSHLYPSINSLHHLPQIQRHLLKTVPDESDNVGAESDGSAPTSHVANNSNRDNDSNDRDSNQSDMTLFDIYSEIYGLDLPESHPLSVLILTHSYPWLQALCGITLPHSEQYLLCNDLINTQDSNIQINTILQTTTPCTYRTSTDQNVLNNAIKQPILPTSPSTASCTTRVTVLSLLQRLVTQSLSTYWLHRDLLSMYALTNPQIPLTPNLVPINSNLTLTSSSATATTTTSTASPFTQPASSTKYVHSHPIIKSNGWSLPLSSLITQLHSLSSSHSSTPFNNKQTTDAVSHNPAVTKQIQLNSQQQLHYSFCIEPLIGYPPSSFPQHFLKRILSLSPQIISSTSQAYSILLHASLQPFPQLAKDVEIFINFVQQQQRNISPETMQSTTKRYIQSTKFVIKAVNAYDNATFNNILTSLHTTKSFPTQPSISSNSSMVDDSAEMGININNTDGTIRPQNHLVTFAQSKYYEIVIAPDNRKLPSTSLPSTQNPSQSTSNLQLFSAFHLFFSFSSYPFIISTLQLPAISLACFGTTTSPSSSSFKTNNTYTHLPHFEQSIFKHLFQSYAMPTGPLLPSYTSITSKDTLSSQSSQSSQSITSLENIDTDQNTSLDDTTTAETASTTNNLTMHDQDGTREDDINTQNTQNNKNQDGDSLTTSSPFQIPPTTHILTNPGCYRTSPQGFVLSTTAHAFSPLFSIVSTFIHVHTQTSQQQTSNNIPCVNSITSQENKLKQRDNPGPKTKN